MSQVDLTLTAAPEDPAQTGTTLGSYRLGRKLGQGGMGAVYEASTPDGRRAAVKVISADSASRDAVRRFMREARATRSIESPHVVRVLDASEDGGTPFLAMELLEGLDLGALVKQSGALEPRAAARLFVQAARGLGAAHDRNLVHRDIKPANLFLHEQDGVVVTKVCDFGVAKHTESADDHASTMDLTRTGGMLGSPLYMSPEQASNAKGVDARTDLWSLCLSLYEALSGQRPWPQCTMVGQLILTICTQDITPLQELAPWVSAELAAVVHKGLERDLSRRWSSSAELAAALEPLALPGEVTLAQLRALTDDHRAQRAPRLAGLAPASSRVVSPHAASTPEPHSADLFTLSASRPPAAEAPSEATGARSEAVGMRSDAAGARSEERETLEISMVPGATILPASPARSGVADPRDARRSGRLIAGLGVVALSAAVVGWIWKSEAIRPSMAASAVPLAASAPPALHRAIVRVSPPEARVSVGGVPRSLSPGGDLALGGEAGESFEVQIEAGGVTREVRVVLARDGRPEPSSLTLPVPSASLAAPALSTPPAAAVPLPGRAGKPAVAPAVTRAEAAVNRPPGPTGEPKMHGDL